MFQGWGSARSGRLRWTTWLMGVLAALLVASPASAATISVNTTTDEFTPMDGLCSLREALSSADFNSSDDCTPGDASTLDTVQLAATTYDLAAPFGTILLQNAVDTGGVEIVGQGMSVTEIQATPTFDSQILATQAAGPLALQDLTIEGGETTGFGGAISDISNSLTLTRVRVADNTASFGGGVYFQPNTTDHPDAALTITDSVIEDNIATNSGTQSFGGGVDTQGVTVITGTTVSGNSVVVNAMPSSTGGGAGVFADGASDLTLVGNLITGNTVDATGTARGGGVEARGTLTAVNDTLTGNSVVTATTRGGGALRYAGPSSPAAGLTNVTIAGNTATTSPGIDSSNPVALRNSIVDNGTAACGGSVTTLGGNIDHGASCWAVGAAGDLQDTDPTLGTLADNGGLTLTIALLPGSPAIDHVPVGSCIDQQSTPQPVTTDQRGTARPQSSACDSGAFEVVQPIVPPPLSSTPPSTITGQRAAALKRCKKKFRPNKAKRRKCQKRAKRLPL
jgi:CSLREA domain-containing protein